MKINNLKHSLWKFIVILLFICMFVYGFYIIIKDIKKSDVLPIILYFIFLIMFIGLALMDLYQIQWVEIDDNNIVAKNIFGVIRKIEIRKIKKAYIDNVAIVSFKHFEIRKKYLVLSTNKSLVKADVDAYNHKKKKYIEELALKF